MEIKSILGEKVLIEWRKMESLQPDNLKMPYNIGHLKKSLLENNFAMPFFGWQNGESVFVIDGHQRREVLSELESEGVKVPELLDCQLINAKDRQEAIKLLLSVFNSKSNPIDLEVLTEWVEMEEVEVEITSLNVVDVNDVQDEIQEILEAEEDDFDGTPPEIPITVLGDLYEIGEHRLLCGDSTDSDLIEKLLIGKTPELLLTDPPYGIDYGNQLVKGDEFTDKTNKHGWRNFGNPEWDKSKPENGVLQYLCQITENQIIWGGNYFTDDLPPTMGWLIWDKGQRGFSLADGEMAWTSFNNALRIKSYARAKANQEEKNHPTQKPQEIMNWCFEYADRHSKIEIKLVLDCYLGSGSTMVASHQLKRKCYGMELDPKYCDVIVKRMIKLDSNLKVKRNGIDETKKWLDKIK